MQHKSDHFTDDWVAELTGNKYEYISEERGNSGQVAFSKYYQNNVRHKAKRCKLGRRKPVQISFNFLQE